MTIDLCEQGQPPAWIGSGLPLSSKTIMTLTDAAQSLFGTMYDVERAHKAATRQRLAAVLANVDLVGLTVNSTAHEEYQPAK